MNIIIQSTAATMRKQANRVWRQRGLTAIELIIGLSIIALVMAGVASTARTMFRDQKINSEVARLQLMQQKLRAYYSTSNTTTGVSANVAVTIGAVSPDAVGGSSGSWTIVSKFGELVTLGSTTLGSLANNAITISYAGVPQVECINFIKAAGPSFDAVGTGGSESSPSANIKSYGQNTPIDNATVENACPSAGTTSIQFTMQRQ